MAGYIHTLDNHFDDLFSHCTHLNSQVESLEQQIKELKEKMQLFKTVSRWQKAGKPTLVTHTGP
jgi:phage shock protein A